jgi:DNA-binding CsgD family transcriptional regulator
VASGRSTREIAARLGLSVHTVAVHRMSLMKRLAVHKTAALVLVAIRHGLVTAD